MPAIDYGMTYAGIPFISNVADKFRMQHPQEEADPTRNLLFKQQPEPDLLDEINRTLPFQYLTDFLPPSNFHGRNLAGIASQENIGPNPSPCVRVGDWYYPTSATRWSVFRGLASSLMVKEMLAATAGYQAKPFIMKAVPSRPSEANLTAVNYTIQTDLYMLPPRVIGEHSDGNEGMYLVTLVDLRYHLQYSPVTLHLTASTTWEDLLAELETAMGVLFSYSAIEEAYGKPEPDSPLWCNVENAPVLLDAVAYNLGRTVVREFDGSFSLLTPAESRTRALASRGSIEYVVREKGGDMFRSGLLLPAGDLRTSRNSIVPNNVKVSFPYYVVGDDPVPHFLNPRYANPRPSCHHEDSYGATYTVDVPIASGGTLSSGLRGGDNTVSIHSTAKALISGEADTEPGNASGLTALAMSIAGGYYGQQVGMGLDEVYPGTFKWTPDGLHDIIWTYSDKARGAFTRVMRTEWNAHVLEMQHSTPFTSGTLHTIPKGVGGPSVAQTIRDSFGLSLSTVLSADLTSGGSTLIISDTSYLPTQNRWVAQVNNERMFVEGTSGGTSIGIIYRGVDGTLRAFHQAGSTVSQAVPNTVYGANLVTFGKGSFVAPSEWTSGGIQGAKIIPQTQSVKVLSNSGVSLNSISHYSGQVVSYDPTKSSGSQFVGEELIWIVARNDESVVSGQVYDGQFVGYSPSPPASIYAVNQGTGGNTFIWNSSDTTINIDNGDNIDLTNEGPFINITIDGGDDLNITGILAQPNRVIIIHNVGPEDIILLHEDSDSLPDNRLWTWTESEQVLKPCKSAILYYPPFLNRWLVITSGNAYEWWSIYRVEIDETKDDWDPSHCTTLYVGTNGQNQDITGIAPREDGGLLLIHNDSIDFITIEEENGFSEEDNRFLHADSNDRILGPHDYSLYQYDTTAGGATGRYREVLTLAVFQPAGLDANRGLVPKPGPEKSVRKFVWEGEDAADQGWQRATISCRITGLTKTNGCYPARAIRWDDLSGGWVDDSEIGDVWLRLEPDASGPNFILSNEDCMRRVCCGIEDYREESPTEDRLVLVAEGGFCGVETVVTATSCVGGSLSVTTKDFEYVHGRLREST